MLTRLLSWVSVAFASAGGVTDLAAAAEGTAALAADVGREPAPLRAVPFTDVTIHDRFWAPRLEAAIRVTLPACLAQCEQTGRLANFDRAAGRAEGGFEGYFFNDSDVYKVIEGAAYALQHRRDAQLETEVDALIERIAAAQQPDGYLNTYFTLTPQEARWDDIRVRHELYCAGHLLEAGIAYSQATGKRKLLDVATRFVDLILREFGPEARQDPPGHQELELALVKLYRLTNDTRYRDLARFFVEQRGVADGRELYGEYSQDHAPVREQDRIVGHAVRALYFLCAVTDLATLDHGAGFDEALDRIWNDTFRTKMYITGGLGPSAKNEGFTTAYDLPNETAYAETCAAIASVLWNHRMNLLHADARYANVLERALYNGALSGVSLAGDRFFYTNPLASDGGHHRQPWYKCACCPSNLARFLPSIGGYVYAQRDDALFVNLYVASEATVRLGGADLRITQATDYPWEGAVRFTLRAARDAEFELALRMPDWSAATAIRLNDKPAEGIETRAGYARLRRGWKDGDTVALDMPMTPTRVAANPKVLASAGRVALQRGPLVYCLEAVDHDAPLARVALPLESELRVAARPDLLGGVRVIQARGLAARPGDAWGARLYRPRDELEGDPLDLTAIPYYAWDNRAAGAMLIWLPESLALAADGADSSASAMRPPQAASMSFGTVWPVDR